MGRKPDSCTWSRESLRVGKISEPKIFFPSIITLLSKQKRLTFYKKSHVPFLLWEDSGAIAGYFTGTLLGQLYFVAFFFWVLLKPIHLNQTLFVLLLGVTLIEKGLTLLQLTVWGPPENSLSTFFFLKIRKQNENFQKLHFFFLFKKRAKRKKSQKQCEKILIVTTQRNLELNVLVFRRTTKNNKPKRLRPQMLKNKNKKNFNFFF